MTESALPQPGPDPVPAASHLDAAEPDEERPVESPPEGEAVAATSPDGARRSVRLVVATLVLLVVFSAAMTVLYARAVAAHKVAAANAASRAAQLDDLRKQLAGDQAQRADLQAQLKTAQDRELDPAGYQKIKDCVQTYAHQEADVTAPRSAPGLNGQSWHHFKFIDPSTQQPVTTCTDAAKYLK